ncbi:MAG: hypothetical protein EPN36_14445 [Rhodanobacteraceae bacterium]|nr:MAG: hypothetical protein EPN36_14445 [Rhodanobacteraceae bacterium]
MQTQSQSTTRVVGTVYGVLLQGGRGVKSVCLKVPDGKSVAETLKAEFEASDDFQPRTKAWGPGTVVVTTQRTFDRQNGKRVVTTVDTSMPLADLDAGVRILGEAEAFDLRKGAVRFPWTTN